MVASPKFESLLAIDVGEKRIGVARAHLDALFPSPLTTLQNPESFVDDIVRLVAEEKAAALIVGLPRGLSGQETNQTTTVRDFVSRLQPELTIPVYWRDEAVTSEKAEAELRSRGKPYAKADIDALAAVYILEDYIKDNPVKTDG
jgi:putative Holliday junction resolvase